MTLPPSPPDLRPLVYVVATNGALALLAAFAWAIEAREPAKEDDPCRVGSCCCYFDDDAEGKPCALVPSPSPCAEIALDETLGGKVAACARASRDHPLSEAIG